VTGAAVQAANRRHARYANQNPAKFMKTPIVKIDFILWPGTAASVRQPIQ
jgi:hypothetical protein